MTNETSNTQDSGAGADVSAQSGETVVVVGSYRYTRRDTGWTVTHVDHDHRTPISDVGSRRDMLDRIAELEAQSNARAAELSRTLCQAGVIAAPRADATDDDAEPVSMCEGGCGPATTADSDGVPLCDACAASLDAETLQEIATLVGFDPARHDDAIDAVRDRIARADATAGGVTEAVRSILAERDRQRTVEGWTEAHDDVHTEEELGIAAACYALPEGYGGRAIGRPLEVPDLWPWAAEWWKPTPDDRRRELVKAGALIIAEIERLDRAAARAETSE